MAETKFTVRRVTSRSELKKFITFPYRFHRNTPNWVPPLRIDQENIFNPKRNAMLRHCDFQLFLLYEQKRIAGRIAIARRRLIRVDVVGHAHLPFVESIGFARTNLAELAIPTGTKGGARLFAAFKRRIDRYHERRDYPALKGPSYLSLHLRFGTVSVRELAGYAWRRASPGAQVWLSELIWRDFYFMILASRPDVVENAFRRKYDALRFDDDQTYWRAWCAGLTGYPLIDAAMRQLERTGYMHNRLRMLAASFLVKDLGIDWRRGERWFAAKLNDYDLAANNGGWQWAASTGCDAQPWFRVFNPVTQSLKFDPQGKFIRRYVTELARVPPRSVHAPWTMEIGQQRAHGCVIGKDYPAPIVDHAAARKRTLERFAAIKPHRSFSGR